MLYNGPSVLSGPSPDIKASKICAIKSEKDRAPFRRREFRWVREFSAFPVRVDGFFCVKDSELIIYVVAYHENNARSLIFCVC